MGLKDMYNKHDDLSFLVEFPTKANIFNISQQILNNIGQFLNFLRGIIRYISQLL